MEAVLADGQPALQGAVPVDIHVGDPAVELHPVTVPAHLRDGQEVVVTAVTELDGTAHAVARSWPPAPGRREEGSPLEALFPVVRVDCHLDERGVGLASRLGGACGSPDSRRPNPVQPAGVRGAGHHLRLVQQPQQERLGRGATAQDDGGLAQGTAQPGQRLRTVPPPSNDLRDHRVVVRRDHLADRDPGVDPDAWPRRQVQELDGAGSRSEVLLGVLGVEPGLDGVAELRRGVANKATAVGDMQLQLDEVEPGRRFGHRVLDLQPGVDLQEREALLGRLVEELHRTGADVARRLDQRDGGLAQLRVLVPRQCGRTGFLDELLVASLDRTVPDTGRPNGSVLVGDDLHLDVPPALHQLLEEDHRVGEGAQCLGLGSFEGVRQLPCGPDDADAAAAAATSCLDDQRIADRGRVAAGVLQVLDGSAAPRRHGDAGLLGQELGLDLVTQATHRLRRRPDEHHREARAQLRERGVLCHEPPADPGCVGPAHAQRPGQLGVVEIRAAAADVSKYDGLVGSSHEPCPTL